MATDYEQERTALSLYLKEVRSRPLLDTDRERELLQKLSRGHVEALNSLIESNLSFVVTIATQYRNLGVEFEDLLNEGNLGLIEAARRFDSTKGVKFITYAVWWIRKSILKALHDHSRIVRLPRATPARFSAFDEPRPGSGKTWGGNRRATNCRDTSEYRRSPWIVYSDVRFRPSVSKSTGTRTGPHR